MSTDLSSTFKLSVCRHKFDLHDLEVSSNSSSRCGSANNLHLLFSLSSSSFCLSSGGSTYSQYCCSFLGFNQALQLLQLISTLVITQSAADNISAFPEVLINLQHMILGSNNQTLGSVIRWHVIDTKERNPLASLTG